MCVSIHHVIYCHFKAKNKKVKKRTHNEPYIHAREAERENYFIRKNFKRLRANFYHYWQPFLLINQIRMIFQCRTVLHTLSSYKICTCVHTQACEINLEGICAFDDIKICYNIRRIPRCRILVFTHEFEHRTSPVCVCVHVYNKSNANAAIIAAYNACFEKADVATFVEIQSDSIVSIKK